MTLFKRCTCADRCAHPWWYEFELRGRRYRKSSRSANHHDAGEIAKKAQRQANREQTGTVPLEAAPKLRTHVEDYLAWAMQDHPATAETKDVRVLEAFTAIVGAGRGIDQIGPFDIERWRSKRSKVVERTTVNRELNVVRSLFTKAVEWRRLATSPVRGVANYRTDDVRVRVLSREEIRIVLTQAPQDLALICRVTLECLPRLSEVLNLRLRDVGPNWIQVRRKGGRVERVQVTSELREALIAWPAQRDGRLFRYAQGAASVAFTRLFRRLRIDGASHHTCRHTGVTLMLEAGVNPRVIQKLAGWTSLRMLERYGHTRDAEVQRAVEATAAKVAESLQNPPQENVEKTLS